MSAYSMGKESEAAPYYEKAIANGLVEDRRGAKRRYYLTAYASLKECQTIFVSSYSSIALKTI